jgi:hypothetical protein
MQVVYRRIGKRADVGPRGGFSVARVEATPVLILLKCLFFLGIVFVALSFRDSGTSSGRPRLAGQATASRRVDEARSAMAGLADRAVDGLTEAARDHCLSHPLDCLHAAERLQGGKTEAAKR